MDRQRLAENREALLSVTERLRASTEPDKSAHFEEASANQQTPLPVKGTAQLRVVTFNLLCTALGTGVLAIPSVFASVGILGGMLLLLVVPAIAERTAAFMTESAESTGVALLYEIMASTFGSAAGHHQFATGRLNRVQYSLHGWRAHPKPTLHRQGVNATAYAQKLLLTRQSCQRLIDSSPRCQVQELFGRE
jgi:hypothetical protein